MQRTLATGCCWLLPRLVRWFNEEYAKWTSYPQEQSHDEVPGKEDFYFHSYFEAFLSISYFILTKYKYLEPLIYNHNMSGCLGFRFIFPKVN